jgi:hypothetical protein
VVRVVRRDHVLEGDDAVGRRAPLLIHVLLDRDRHAMQRSDRTAGAHRLIVRLGLAQRGLAEIVHDRIDLAVGGAHARHGAAHGLDGGHRARRDRVGQLTGAPLPQRPLRVCHCSLLSASRCGLHTARGALDDSHGAKPRDGFHYNLGTLVAVA